MIDAYHGRGPTLAFIILLTEVPCIRSPQCSHATKHPATRNAKGTHPATRTAQGKHPATTARTQSKKRINKERQRQASILKLQVRVPAHAYHVCARVWRVACVRVRVRGQRLICATIPKDAPCGFSNTQLPCASMRFAALVILGAAQR